MRMLMNFRVLLLVLLLLAAVGCKQQVKSDDPDYVAAHQSFENMEFEDSFKLMCKSAQNGNSDAQNDLGWMYKNGVGVLQNIDEARYWYERSASSGNSKAMHALGSLFLDYYKDCIKAEEWYLKAVKLKSSTAALALYNMYKDGVCFEINMFKSQRYYELVSEYSNDLYTFAEGNKLFWSAKSDEDYNKSIMLLNKVFSKYPDAVGYNLGVAYFNGLGVVQDKSKAVDYYFKSAMAGYTKSQFNLGVCLFNGWGTGVDKEQAFQWIKKSASKNHMMSLTFIGYMYETGEVVERDIERAKEYYQRAAKLGDSRAQNRLNRLK